MTMSVMGSTLSGDDLCARLWEVFLSKKLDCRYLGVHHHQHPTLHCHAASTDNQDYIYPFTIIQVPCILSHPCYLDVWVAEASRV